MEKEKKSLNDYLLSTKKRMKTAAVGLSLLGIVFTANIQPLYAEKIKANISTGVGYSWPISGLMKDVYTKPAQRIRGSISMDIYKPKIDLRLEAAISYAKNEGTLSTQIRDYNVSADCLLHTIQGDAFIHVLFPLDKFTFRVGGGISIINFKQYVEIKLGQDEIIPYEYLLTVPSCSVVLGIERKVTSSRFYFYADSSLTSIKLQTMLGKINFGGISTNLGVGYQF